MEEIVFENCVLEDNLYYAIRLEGDRITAFSVMTELKGR